MKFFSWVILGLLQGLCEFLPISSSGHLVLFSALFGIEDSLLVSVVLHIATLLAVVVVYFKDIKNLLLNPFSNDAMRIYIATIPTCLIAIILMPLINISFGGKLLWGCFLFSAILLFCVDFFAKKKDGKDFNNKTAFIMGIAQGLAVFPGISRSGATISAGILSGGEKKECTNFSFLMSLPIIVMSMVLEVAKLAKGNSVTSVSFVGLAIAFVVAFLVGIVSIKIMINITQKLQLKWFGIYLLIISIMCIILL